MGYGLGVDLGTSFTGAAISRGGHARMVTLGEHTILMPSVVRVQADGTLIAGDAAGRGGDADPSRTGRDFKRRLGDPTPLILGGQPHSAVSLLAATLASVVKTVTALEEAAPEAVTLTYPAVWGPYRSEQFAEVPRRAGLDPALVTITTEPEAAATHYATRQKLTPGDIVAVYDLGGGTFDTTVTKLTDHGMEILGVPEGVEWVGGVDFDEAVLTHVDKAVGGALSALDPRDPASAIALQRIRDECVRAKEALSRDTATNIVVLLPHRHTQVRLTRAEFEGMIRTPLESTLAALHRTMNSAGVKSEDLAGVLLVGGSSRIPLVSRMLTEDLGRPVLVDPHPQHCVALGAASLAGTSTGSTPASPAPDRPATAGVRAESPAKPGGLRRRRRLIAATAGAVVLIGAAAASYPVLRPSSAHPGPAASSAPDPTMIGAPDATRTATATASPTSSPTVATVALSSLKVPSLPVTTEVLGLAAKCMDVANAVATNGNPIQIFGCNNTPAQSWILGTDHTFRSLGKCLTAGASAGAGPVVQLQDCSTSTAQKWQVRPGGAIVNLKSKLCLDVLGKSSADRTLLVLSRCQHEDSQLWTFPPAAGSVTVAASSARPRVAMTIRGLDRRPQGVAVSPDGTRAYVPSVVGNTLSVIDTSNGRIIRKILMPAAPQYITAAPDGRRLYVTLNRASTTSNSVEVVDAATGDLLHRIKVGATPFAPAVSPNGLLLYVPDHASSKIIVIDTVEDVVTARIPVPTAPHWVAFTPDGLHAYVADHETSQVSVIDVASGTVTGSFPVGISPLAIAVSPDGQQVAVANYDARSVSLISTTDNTVGVSVKVGRNPQSVAFAPDGQHLYVVNDGSDSLSVIDVQTRKVTSTVAVGHEPWAVAVSPSGKHAYVTNATSDTLTVLNTGS